MSGPIKQTCPNCKIYHRGDYREIIFCPLHGAAQQMLEALHRAAECEGLQNWGCGKSIALEAVHAAIKSAEAK